MRTYQGLYLILDFSQKYNCQWLGVTFSTSHNIDVWNQNFYEEKFVFKSLSVLPWTDLGFQLLLFLFSVIFNFSLAILLLVQSRMWSDAYLHEQYIFIFL